MSEETSAATPENVGSQVTESAPPSDEPAWYLDDATPGIGARPSWLPPKYKKASDLGKAYVEAEKKLGAFTGAPEAYDLSELDIDDTQLLVQEVMSVGKELNLSQDGMKKFLGRIATAAQTEAEAHIDDQVKALGKEGETLLKEYQHWTKNHLKPEQLEVVKGWVRTADDLKTFNHLMSNTTLSAVPTSQSQALSNNHESVADLRKELSNPDNLKRYENDKAYTKNYSTRLRQAYARENR